METPCLCAFQGHKYGRRKLTETSFFVFSYLCVNSSLEELMKIKAIFNSKTRNVWIAKSPKIRNVFNPHKSFPGGQLNAASRKSLEIQASCIAKQRTLLNRKFVV